MKIAYLALMTSQLLFVLAEEVDEEGGIYNHYEGEEDWDFIDPLNNQKKVKKKKSEYIEYSEYIINDCKDISSQLDSCRTSLTKLNSCEHSLKQVQDKLITCKIDHGDNVINEVTYLKHIIRVLNNSCQTFDDHHCKVQFKITNEAQDKMVNVLDDGVNTDGKFLYDLIVDTLEPNLLISPQFTEEICRISTPVLLGSCVCYILLTLVILFRQNFTFSNSKFNVVLILFFCFVCSIPWEWYRMYKAKLAEKVANMNKKVPASCNPENMTALDSISFWLKGKFSTAENDCVVYYQDILVDPFWEVSPLTAFLSCGTKFVVVPITYFSSAVGKSFKLLMDEIPLQWQLPVFVAILFIIVVVIMIMFGFEISTPLLKIGFRNHQHQVEYYKLKLQESEGKYEKKCIEHARLNENRNANIEPIRYIGVERIDQESVNVRRLHNVSTDVVIRRRPVDSSSGTNDIVECLDNLTIQDISCTEEKTKRLQTVPGSISQSSHNNHVCIDGNQAIKKDRGMQATNCGPCSTISDEHHVQEVVHISQQRAAISNDVQSSIEAVEHEEDYQILEQKCDNAQAVNQQNTITSNTEQSITSVEDLNSESASILMSPGVVPVQESSESMVTTDLDINYFVMPSDNRLPTTNTESDLEYEFVNRD